jgi:transcriptional regulator with PAS, ATPase and Fis domain
LRNVIERLVVTSPHAVIEPAELPDFLAAHDQAAKSFVVRVGMTLAESEKLLIRQTLTQLTSNREEAAQALGISRRALQYKLRRYGLLEG